MSNEPIILDTAPTTTGPERVERPAWQQANLERAFDLVEAYTGADDVIRALQEQNDLITVEEVQKAGPMETMIRGMMILMSDVGAMLKAAQTFDPERKNQKCGYCIHAAGNDQEAWNNSVGYDGYDAIVKHTTSCEHNPLVKRRDELLATIARLTNELPFPDEVKNWTDQRAKLVAEVGTLKARVVELEAQVADERKLHEEGAASYHAAAKRTCESLAAQVKELSDERMRFITANAELGELTVNMHLITTERLARIIYEELDRDDWGKVEPFDFDLENKTEYTDAIREVLDRVVKRLKEGT